MKRCLLAMMCLVVPASGTAAAMVEQPLPKMIYQHAPTARIDPLEHAPFKRIEAELRNVVRRHGDRTVPNHFCAVGYRLTGGTMETVLIWDEAQWLIRWWGSDAQGLEERDAVSASFSPVTDLRTDMVEDNRFPLGTRAVVRADAEALIDDCQRFGRQYNVAPLPPDEPDDAY